MAKTTELLNDDAVRDATVPGKYPDGDGLYLVVLPSGTKSWRMRYWFKGREKQIGFGVLADVSATAARRLRVQAKADLLNGIDPSAKRRAVADEKALAFAAVRDARAKSRESRKAAAGALKFGELAQQWFDHFAGGWRNAKHRAQVWRSLEVALKPIWAMPPDDVKPSDVRDIVVSINLASPEVARRTLQRAAAVYRWGCAMERCKTNPAAAFKPRDVFPQRARGEERHFARIGVDELPALMQAIVRYRGWQTRLGLRLLAYLFVRSGELRGARWTEIDLEGALWKIPATRMKASREHLVPLSRQAVSILRELHALNGRTPFVLPMEKSLDKPASENVFLQALDAMGFKGRMTGHGFRGIASTQLREMGFPAAHIERQLAHVDESKTRRAYNSAEYLPARRAMLQAWADYLDGLTGA